jgi:hypothetical protein
MRKRSRVKNRYDYVEEEHFKIISASTVTSLATKVTKVIQRVRSDNPPGQPNSGQFGQPEGSPLYAQERFHQAVTVTFWREVEHELSELAKVVEGILLAAGSDGFIQRDLRIAVEGTPSITEMSRALREIPAIRKVVEPDGRVRVFLDTPSRKPA